MERWKRWLLAGPVLILCVAATQWATRGTHEPTGNIGYLGTELAGVEGTSTLGGEGALGRGLNGVVGIAGSGGSGVIGTGSTGVQGDGTGGSASIGVAGTGEGTGVLGHATGATGEGVSGTGYVGVAGYSTSTSSGTQGVLGEGELVGVRGRVRSTLQYAAGLVGEGPTGVYGVSTNGFAVEGNTTNGTGIYGVLQQGGGGHAGYFDGRVHVNGTLSKSAGSFRIDHPLDPANKYLSHSFVESPDMKNIYDGVVTLSADGTALVELPEWFEALNKDFRYQLTCVGEHAPVYIAEEIQENRFLIAGGYAGMRVSWQVTGSRRDPYAEAFPIIVEEAKSPLEVGRFLHPELYREPASMRVGPSRR